MFIIYFILLIIPFNVFANDIVSVKNKSCYVGADVMHGEVNSTHKECFYIGQDIHTAKIICIPDKNKVKDVKQFATNKHSLPNINLYVGYPINSFSSIETGVQFSPSLFAKEVSPDTRNNLVTVYSTIVAAIPLSQKVEIVPGIGFGYLKLRLTESHTKSFFRKESLVPRLMVALQYKATETLKIRISVVQYLTAGLSSNSIAVSNFLNIGIGFNRSF